MPVGIIYIAAAMLFVGAAPLPYGYYLVLRVIATTVFIWAAVVSNNRNEESLPWIFGGLAILFNPLLPIHLPKEAWMFIDVFTGVLLLVTKSKIQQHADR